MEDDRHFGGIDRYLYDRVERLRHGWLDLADPPPVVCLFCDDFESGDSCEWSETQPPAGCLLGGPRGGPPPGGPRAPQVVERDQEYVFDLYGNIQSIATDGATVSTPTDSATNRLVSGMGTAYDSRGNLIARPGYVFVYDALDRLVRRQASGELRQYHFLYTADDERILTFVDELPGSGGTDEFRWTLRDLGGTVLRDSVSVAGEAALCVAEDYVFRGSSLLGARQYSCDSELPSPPQDLHYTLDHLGTPRLVTSASATVVEERKYFPFGEEAKPANPEGPRLRFTGHERDVFDLDGTQDDLDYMHARFYQPLTGRFLSVDPVLTFKRAMRQPQLWNRYAYVAGSPLRFVDPTGESIAVVFDFSDSDLSLLEQTRLRHAVAQAFREAGVKEVSTHLSGDPMDRDQRGGANPVVFVGMTREALGKGQYNGETLRVGGAVGRMFGLPLSNNVRVSSYNAPSDRESRIFFLANVAIHEIVHGSRAIPEYDADGYGAGGPEASVTEALSAPDAVKLWSRRFLGFAPVDASRLQERLNP